MRKSNTKGGADSGGRTYLDCQERKVKTRQQHKVSESRIRGVPGQRDGLSHHDPDNGR